MSCWPWLALVAFALVPSACAGLRISSIDIGQDPSEPDVGQTPVHVLGDVDCASLLLRRDAASTGGVLMSITWGAENLLISGPLQTLVDPAPCGPQVAVVAVNVSLTATVLGTAPAMQPQPAWVRWQLPEHASEPVDEGFAQANVSLRSLPLVVPQVIWDRTAAELDDEPVTFTASARNLGNVDVRLVAEARGRTMDNGVPGQPANVTVRVDSQRVQVDVGVPTERWSVLLVHGNLTFTSAVEPRGEPRVVPFQFLLTSSANGNKADQVGIPLPTAVPLLAVATALVLRRRS